MEVLPHVEDQAKFLNLICRDKTIDSFKERVGFGYTRVILAQKIKKIKE